MYIVAPWNLSEFSDSGKTLLKTNEKTRRRAGFSDRDPIAPQGRQGQLLAGATDAR
jgi:hypothetical protein